jgi:predicted metal-dependent hydrolase
MKIRPNKFNFSNTSKLWFFGSKFWTFFWNSNSIFLEHSEKMLIKTLTEIKSEDSVLLEEIKITKAQENWHKFNHNEFNKILGHQYNISNIDKNARKIIIGLNFMNLDKRVLLFYVFETLTVLLAKIFIFLCKKNKFNKEDEVIQFWLWHANEEIEHGYVTKKLVKEFKISKLSIIGTYPVAIYFYIKYLISSMYSFYRQHKIYSQP